MLSRLMTVREQWLLLGLAGAIVLGAGVLIWHDSARNTPLPDTYTPREEMVPDSTPVPAPSINSSRIAPPTRIAVGILGAVRKEGLYYFDNGARVADLLKAAGGVRPEGDLSDINRTALLLDESTLLVPELVTVDGRTYSYPSPTYNPVPYTRSTWYRFGEPTTDSSTNAPRRARASSAPASNGPININTASQSELESLPGIGPATAQKIIAHRQSQPFATTGDLEKVSGIGPAKMAAVRGLIAVK